MGPLLALILAACSSPATPEADATITRWRAEVVATFAHDPGSFTQGLELRDGVLYESAGGFGTSHLTLSNWDNRELLQRKDLPEDMFAEGITLAGDRLWQLTWRNHVALLRDRATLEVIREFELPGEGWGICYQAEANAGAGRLVTSDGSAQLTLRDPQTFAEVGKVPVTLDGRPQDRLNELECTGGNQVWANVWQSAEIVRIDVDSGRVTGVLHVDGVPDFDDGVLNGIAALPGTDDLLITGKNWPHLYRVRLEKTAGPGR